MPGSVGSTLAYMYTYMGVPYGRPRRYLEAGATKSSYKTRVWFKFSIYMYYLRLTMSSLTYWQITVFMDSVRGLILVTCTEVSRK